MTWLLLGMVVLVGFGGGLLLLPRLLTTTPAQTLPARVLTPRDVCVGRFCRTLDAIDVLREAGLDELADMVVAEAMPKLAPPPKQEGQS